MRLSKTVWAGFATLVMALACGGSDSSGPPVISTLQNDDFSGGSPTFEAGFVSGDAAAARLGPQTAGFTIRKVQFLFGGDTATKTFTLTIYADSGTTNPGAVLHSADYSRKGSNSAMQEIDLSSLNLHVAAQQTIRVAIAFQHDGVPSVAIDGARTASRNLINANPTGWTTAEALGINGDFIIRTEISTP